MKVKGFPVGSKIGFLVFIMIISPLVLAAQVAGDYRSRATQMNWDTASDWEVFNGSGWTIASQKPGIINNVFIQNGHVVTLTGQESCNDLHLSTGLTTASNGTDAKLALQNFVLQVNGKLRAYFAPIGTVPGTSAAISGDPITIIPGGAGKLTFVGDTRNITNTGEWSALSTAYPTTFALEIKMNPGQTAYLNTVVKASAWQITSGILDAGDNRVSADNGSDNQGDFYVAAGAVFKSAKSGTGNNAVLSRGATTAGGNFIVDGTLVLTGASPCVGMRTVLFNGTIEYARTTTQKFVAGINGGQVPLLYNHIKLTGAGSKTTVPDTVTNLAPQGLIELGGGAQPALFALGSGGRLAVNATGTRLIYNATAAQTTGNEWQPDFAEIVINNPAGVSLNAAKQLNGTLVFINGNLTTTPTRILTIESEGSITGAGEHSFVNGPLTRVLASSSKTELTFPVGKNAVYKPVVLTVTQNSGLATNYTTEVFNTPPTSRTLPNDLNNVSTLRYYKLTKGSGGASITQASLKIFYGADDVVTDPGNLRIARSSASNWLNVGGTGEPMVQGAGNITSDVNFSTLGDFVLANAKGGLNPLPVTWASFEAIRKSSAVWLKWQTLCEKGNSRFEVERSSDGVTFEKLGEVAAAGNSTELQQYAFNDNKPLSGIIYYRLKQVDFDGTTAYSKVIGVQPAQPVSQLAMYPNPATDVVYLKIPTEIINATVQVLNSNGQVLLTRDLNQTTIGELLNFDLRFLPPGMYLVNVNGNGISEVQKLIKK